MRLKAIGLVALACWSTTRVESAPTDIVQADKVQAQPPSGSLFTNRASSITRQLVETRRSSSNEIMELEQLLRRNPDDFRLHFALGRAYESIGLHGFAEQEDEICDKAGPEFHKYVLALFKDRVDHSDYNGATLLFRYVDRHYPADPSVLLVGAVILEHQGRLAEAEDNLNRILKTHPQEPGVFAYFGFLKLKEDRLEDAEHYFDLELKERPASREAAIGKAKVAELQGRNKTALDILAPIYRETPLRRGLADSVANCLVRTNLRADAAAPALFAVAAATREGELRRAKSRVIMIWPQLTVQVRARALKEITTYLERTQDVLHTKHFCFAFGDALLKAEFWQEARVMFVKGLTLDPLHGHAYYHLGEIAQNYEHNYRDANLAYLRALELTPPEDRSEREFRDLVVRRITRLTQVMKTNKKNIAGNIKSTLRAARVTSD